MTVMDPFETRIGDLLLKEKVITQEQLNTALRKQQQGSDIPIGHILLELGYVRYSTLLTVLSLHLHIPRAEAALADRKLLKQRMGLAESGKPAETKQQKPQPKATPKAKTQDDLTFDPSKPPAMPLGNLPLPDLTDLHKLPSGKGDEYQLVMMVSDLLATEDWEEAEALTSDALQSFPDSPQINWQAVYVHLANNHYQKAQQRIDNLDHQLKQLIPIQVLTAFTWTYNRKYQAAMKLLQKLVKQPSAQPSWYFMLGFCLVELEQKESATKILKLYMKHAGSGENRFTRFARQKIKEFAE